MVKLINKFTGTVMYVDVTREAEYLEAGHKPASKSAKPKKTRKKKVVE